MHFCLVTYGSRGDVQPFIYLALGLKAKGHEVTLAAPSNFVQLVSSYSITFYPLQGDAEEIVKTPECRKVMKTGSDIAFARMALKKMRADQLFILDDIYEACKNADAIISINICIFYTAAVAEKLNKKYLFVQLNPPMVPTREFPVYMFGMPNISALNYYTYAFATKMLWLLQKKQNALFRRQLGLPKLHGSVFDKALESKIPVIHAFSQELIQKPADWGAAYIIAGFFTQPQVDKATSKLQDGLEEWINAGEKPLYIGFGSIPFPNNKQISDAINGILSTADTRIIYCRGWSDMPELKPNPRLFLIEQADHAWLLPRCRAAVIHGGIGTIAAVMKAGIPAIVASILVDQPAWGKIIEAKNLGVHIPWRKLNAASILNALKRIEEQPIASNIKAVNARLLKEDGIAIAIQTIESYCS